MAINDQYPKTTEAPKREDRLSASCTYGGSLCDIKSKASCGCLKFSNRSFTQTQGCQLYLASSIINTMLDVAIVVYGSIGCGSANIFSAGTTRTVQRARDSKAQGLLWLSTNLNEADVITGGEKKLREAVLYADKTFRPQAILVVNTCVPSLIGDDVDSMLSKFSDEVTAKLVPIHCAGFKTTINATAYDSVYHGILRTLLDPYLEKKSYLLPNEHEEYEETLKKSKSVNLFNVSSMSQPDEAELSRLLSLLDLNTQIYPCYSKPESYRHIGEAALNVSVCPTHDDYFTGHLKELFGTPNLYGTIPIGLTNTRKWFQSVALFFGMEDTANRLIELEEARLKEALIPYRAALQGKRVYLTGGSIRTLATAEFLREDLGMEIIGVKSYHYDAFAEPLIESLSQNGDFNYSIATAQEFEQANLLRRLKPDLYIGHVELNGWAARQGIPVFPLFMVSMNYMGYSGAFELARKLARIVKNASFNQNLAKYTKLPYKESWYAEDPFKYIND